MMNVLLICYAGMSTSLLVSKLEKTAKAHGKEMAFEAIGTVDFDEYAEENIIDYILMGPQARHMEQEILAKCTELGLSVPLKVIDSLHYGRMDTEAILSMLE